MTTAILALDVASSSGWAFGSIGDTPQHGVFTLPPSGDDLGRALHTFATWLSAKVRELQPREIVFEAPILPAQTNIKTLKKLYCLAGMVEFIAAIEGVPCSEITAGEWRKAFLGPYYPKSSTRDELKRAVIAACRQMGWEPRQDDDADAMGILYVTQCARNQQASANDAVNRMVRT